MASHRGAVMTMLLAVVMLAAVSGTVSGAITCRNVLNAVLPCFNYLRGGGPTVPEQCCNGIRSLIATAQTTPDKQTACNCLKAAARSAGAGINYSYAAGLPGKCNANIPYPISPNTDCSKVR